MAKSTAESFLKDIVKEEQFLKAVKKGKLKGVETEVELMVKVLNEQTESLCRYRFDVDLWQALQLLEGKHEEDLKKAEHTVRNLRITVRTIREHILKKLGAA